jgi:hypothetical protein
MDINKQKILKSVKFDLKNMKSLMMWNHNINQQQNNQTSPFRF